MINLQIALHRRQIDELLKQQAVAEFFATEQMQQSAAEIELLFRKLQQKGEHDG